MSSTPPKGMFKGANFMTPEILSYHRLGADTWAELSTGMGINRQPIWGVTVRPEHAHKVSKLFWSKAQAMRYIKGMTEEGQ